MTATFGRTSLVPLAFYDPVSRSLRTSQGIFPLGSTSSSPTLPISGSMHDGALFAHPQSVPLTSGTGCSSSPGLPTPRARDAKGKGFPDGLPSVASLLPTPSTSEATGTGHAAQGGMNLRHAVSLLPTPRATDGDKGGPNQRGSKGDLTLPSAAHRIGVLTSPPSGDGNASSDAVPPGQLTLWDG